MLSVLLICLWQAEFQLKVKPDITIYRDTILLKDVVSPESYSELKAMGVGNLKIADGPSYNQNRTIHRTLVASRLKTTSPDLEVSYDGPSSTVVRRAGGTFSEAQLREAVQDFIEQQHFGDGTLHIDDIRVPSNVRIPPGPVRYEIRARGNGLRLGRGALYADIFVNDQKERTLVVSMETSLETAVPILIDDVQRGTPLSDDNVIWEYRRLTRLDGPMIEPGDLLGLRSRYILKRGSILSTRNTEGIPLVIRNTMVSVNVVRGAMRMSLRAKALENGAKGDLIRLQNVDSGQYLHGTVTERGDVELNH